MDRRKFITSVGTFGTVAIAGCSGDTNGSIGGDEQQEAEQEAQTEQQEDSSASSTYQVRIRYDGEWSGSISSEGSSRSVDGSGTQTIDIEDEPNIISANAQKQDDSSRELTIQILEDGVATAEESTTAEFGVAQVTFGDGVSSGGGGGSSGSTYQVRIVYDGEWQGSISQGGSVRSTQGSGTEIIEIEGTPDIISANAQKQDNSSRELTVQIVENGEVVKETSTTAEYGVAQVSYSNF